MKLFLALFVIIALTFSLFTQSNAKLITQITEKELTGEVTPLTPLQNPEKDWNFIIYMVGNGLYNFALESLKEMLQVGSTSYCNIIVQIDHAGQSNATRFFIEKDKAALQSLEQESSGFLRGTPASLYFFAKWAIQKYPAKHHALILWNHTSGIKHPNIWEKLYKENRDQLFQINPETGLLELNRIGTIKNDSISTAEQEESSPFRSWGASLSQPTEVFINEQELRQCLLAINSLLKGKKLELIVFDSCHLALLEMASICKKSVNIMVASQEIEPENGCNFSKLLEPFTRETMNPEALARHIVQTFEDEYASSFADFTLSAINLLDFDSIESSISRLSQLFLDSLKKDCGFYFFINKIRESSILVTEFFDRDYIDLYHFLTSFLSEYEKQACSPDDQVFIDIKNTILSILRLLDQRIITRTAGINLKKSRGLSIYFPKRSIHSSYLKVSGLEKNNWTQFLSKYIKIGREL